MTKGKFDFDAIVVGAGFSGMYQLHLLRDKLGLNVLGIEAGGGVGGTWYWNRYPGARCDSESHSYNYFFSDEIIQNWEWSERYPGQEEIRRYLNYVADTLKLRSSFEFNSRVVGARFHEDLGGWSVTTENGVTRTCQFFITAVGCLSSANMPNIKGLDKFQGSYYHTGNWPHEGVDFSGKRVGQIGTGSTGIQCVPVIAQTAKELRVFQRTANYSIPAHNGPLDDEFKQHVKDNIDYYRALVKKTPNAHPFEISPTKAFDVDDETRLDIYNKAWQKGGLQFRASFQDLLADDEANKTAAEFIKEQIRTVVSDKETAEKLANIDHPFATKRPPIDSHYFETYNEDHVHLIDVRSDPIDHIDEHGLVLKSGARHDLDIIVFATGFDAMTGSLLNLNITGKQGQPLKDAWSAGPYTYLGLQVSGFPNMFTITGPGSPSVLCNMPVAIEQHVEWIADCIAYMREHDHQLIETDDEHCKNWVAEVNRAAEATLLPKANHSWYLGANVPGKPRVFMPYAGGMHHYRKICDDVQMEGYAGFHLQ